MSRPRARERKPSWLRQFVPKSSPLVVTVCEGCGLYVIEDRETVWESWDYGCVAGDDLTVAIILGRPLTRVTWLPSVGHPLLRSTCGDAGIRPDGQYLAMHMCHLAWISVKPFKPPKRERPPGKPWGGPKLSKQEIAEFKRIWNMPYSRLKYEKAPTVVGQGDDPIIILADQPEGAQCELSELQDDDRRGVFSVRDVRTAFRRHAPALGA